MDCQSWFAKGAAALGSAAPVHRGRGYACPICLRIYPSATGLTVEDVPPKAVGGRPLLLTCRECNSGSGAMLDWHWVKFVEVEGFGERHLPKPITVTLTYEGLDVVAALSHDGSGFA